MAMYPSETTAPADDLGALRQHFEMTKERHGHMRATLRGLLGETCARMERECKEMSEDIDRLHALYPDAGNVAEQPRDSALPSDPQWSR